MKKRLKITYIAPLYWPVIGGCELHTHELVKRMSQKHDVNVITLISRQKDKERGGDFWFACILSSPPRPEFYKDNKAAVTKLALNNMEKLFLFPLLRIQSPKVPTVLRNRALSIIIDYYVKKLHSLIGECDLIHGIHGNVSWLGHAAFLTAKQRNIPFIYTPVSHLFTKESINKQSKIIGVDDLVMSTRGPVNETWLETCKMADSLIALTNYEREFFIHNKINLHTFTTGVGPIIRETQSLDFRKKYNLGAGKIVLFLGRVNRDKGIEDILQSADLVWKEFPDTNFLFLGPMEWGAEALFERYKDNRIIATGHVEVDEKSAALKACDILCVPSILESLGGIYLEAWYFEKPVICADIPPTRELIGNDLGGTLIKPSPKETAKAILELFKNPDKMKKAGQWGKKKVGEKYEWNHLVSKTEEIYFRGLGIKHKA